MNLLLNAGICNLDLLGQNLLNVNTSALYLLNGAVTNTTANGAMLSPSSPSSNPSAQFLSTPPGESWSADHKTCPYMAFL